jgi:hypothetical protein
VNSTIFGWPFAAQDSTSFKLNPNWGIWRVMENQSNQFFTITGMVKLGYPAKFPPIHWEFIGCVTQDAQRCTMIHWWCHDDARTRLVDYCRHA